MDIHRSRFVSYPVSAITALSFTRSSDSCYSGPLPALRLAVGRANGTIEIWNPQRGAWVQETIFSPPQDNKGAAIDDLIWTQDPDETDSEGKAIPGQHRLFSISASPSVSEWDLTTGSLKRRSTGNFSEVWSFAAQPRWRAGKGSDAGSADESRAQEIVAGCGDGTLIILSTEDRNLQFKKVLVRVSGKRARCMSVTYQTRDRIVAGFADSMIRVYDTRNGMCLVNMGLGVGVPGAPKNALVWKVKCLPNGDIISGDSNGEVRVWDGKMYSQLQRMVAHDTDCLDLVTGSDGKTIFSGSMDGKIAMYRLSIDGAGRKTWAKGHHRRVHQGEVKAMAAFDSKSMSVVVSGGSDGCPTVSPLREYGREHIRALSSLPQEPPVTSAAKARLLVSWWESDIYVWRIAAQQSAMTTSPMNNAASRKLVARISLKSKTSIQSVSISNEGNLLAAASHAGVRLFQLRRRLDEDKISVRKIEIPKEISQQGARLVEISPDLKWLTTVTVENEVYIARIITNTENPRGLQVLNRAVELDRPYRRPGQASAFKEYDRTVNRLAYSPHSNVLVVSDLSGHLDSWVLEGNEDVTAAPIDIAQHKSEAGSVSDASSESSSSDSDSDDEEVVFYGQHWTENPAGHLLPKLDSTPLVLTFRPNPPALALTNGHRPRRRSSSIPHVNGNPGVHATRHNPHAYSHTLPTSTSHHLWCMTAKHQMYELDVLQGHLTDWSRRNPTAVLPQDFTQIRERVMGCAWDSSSPSLTTSEPRDRLWLYGSNFLFMLDLSGDLMSPVPSSSKASNGVLSAVSSGSPRKRRRGDEKPGQDAHASSLGQNMRKLRRIESGAGGAIAAPDAGVSGSVKVSIGDEKASRLEMSKLRGEEEDEELEKIAEDEYDQGDDDDDDDDEVILARLRSSRSDEDDVEAPDEANGDGQALTTKKLPAAGQRKWWISFKYRPILGMVPLSVDKGKSNSSQAVIEREDAPRFPEVALVERPLWDVMRDRQRGST